MGSPKDERGSSSRLRQQAEDILRGGAVDLKGIPIEDIQYLLHELQVHQVELTLQNEELRRVQLELEIARDRYSDLYHFAPVGYCTLDRKDTILEANQALAILFGYEQARMLQTRLSDYVFRDDQDAYYLHRQRIVGTGARQRVEIQMVKRSGERLFVQLESAIDHEEDTYIWTVVSDISERKRAEKELRIYTQELERSNQALQDFTFIASHDLQEPLRKVKAFGQILAQRFGDELGAEGNDYIGRINSAAERMSAMLQGILNLSKVTSESHATMEVDLNVIVAEILADLEASLMQTGGKVEVGVLPVIQADGMQMRQLLQNLIANAIKYHSPGVPPLVTVSSRFHGNERVEIMVTDNGIGIDMKNAEYIFEPFARLNGRSEFEGSGMGLSICKKIVERHGGSIQVESSPLQGSTFRVNLPYHS